jgi:hypothetical protein
MRFANIHHPHGQLQNLYTPNHRSPISILYNVFRFQGFAQAVSSHQEYETSFWHTFFGSLMMMKQHIGFAYLQNVKP